MSVFEVKVREETISVASQHSTGCLTRSQISSYYCPPLIGFARVVGCLERKGLIGNNKARRSLRLIGQAVRPNKRKRETVKM